MNLNELRDVVHRLAVDRGWYENRDVTDPNVLGAMLALIHSEVSEALEEIRDHHPFIGVGGVRIPAGGGDTKPIGFASELADIIIRTLDLCGALGIDIEQAVILKHRYNATRTHRHGGKKL